MEVSVVKRPAVLALLALAATASACGGDNSGPAAARSPASIPPPSATPTWAGYPQPEEGAGDISVTEFNQFVEETNPPWRGSPLRATMEFIFGGEPPAPGKFELPPITTTLVQNTTPETGTKASVTLVEEGLYDDSTAAVRYRLDFQRQNGGIWRLTSAFVDQRCARGPDTKNFTTELCI